MLLAIRKIVQVLLMQGGSKSQRVDLERRGTRESQAIPAPDANAELVLSMQKRKSQYNSKSRSEKFNPHPEEVASGFPIDPPRESQVAESSSAQPEVLKRILRFPGSFKEASESFIKHCQKHHSQGVAGSYHKEDGRIGNKDRNLGFDCLLIIHTILIARRPDSIIICILVHLDYGSSHKIHYSGPLIVLSGNVYQMLKDQDLQVQEAVRRGHVDKAKFVISQGFCRGGVFERWPVLTISYVYSLLKNLFAIHHLYFSFHSATFAFDGFNTSKLLLYGNAKLDSGAISLTQDTTFSIGRALYHAKIPLKHTNSSTIRSFETSFTFSITPYNGQRPGHGLVFIFVPSADIQGAAASQYLGFLNRTNDGNRNNNVFGIEFDIVQNQEFYDINNNHVGLNVNSIISVTAYKAGYWFQDNQNKTNWWHFHALKLNNGKIYRVWIDYKDSFLGVSIAPAKMKKPLWPLLNVFIDLSDFFLDEMYAGFCAATGQLIGNHKILSWSFSN
ncbi:hypothetical protein CUMW_107380 [Citrus unshiu]|uniref:Legume lectin domain-containing protein n=1 Tax=Citrus unshiu TaxID=55188 RepID=A0A2H5P662_CITUN|nr:hypothetical protein CUMW_107380 [Citrus unshiu]